MKKAICLFFTLFALLASTFAIDFATAKRTVRAFAVDDDAVCIELIRPDSIGYFFKQELLGLAIENNTLILSSAQLSKKFELTEITSMTYSNEVLTIVFKN